jgi:hypothetical protein
MKNKSLKTVLIVGGIVLGLCIICFASVMIYNATPAGKSHNATQTQIALAALIAQPTHTLVILTSSPILANTPAQTNTPILTDTPTQTSTPISTDTLASTNTPTETPDPNLVEPGTYLVGKDIKPGLYKGNTVGCYWEREKDLSGSFDSIISNGNTQGLFYIQVGKSDAALSVECEVVLLDPLPVHSGEYPQTLQPGQYLIGIDIKPGLYKGNAEGCYWERQRDLFGGFDSIISNGNTQGPFYIQVNKSDAALSVGCEVTWTSD